MVPRSYTIESDLDKSPHRNNFNNAPLKPLTSLPITPISLNASLKPFAVPREGQKMTLDAALRSPSLKENASPTSGRTTFRKIAQFFGTKSISQVHKVISETDLRFKHAEKVDHFQDASFRTRQINGFYSETVVEKKASQFSRSCPPLAIIVSRESEPHTPRPTSSFGNHKETNAILPTPTPTYPNFPATYQDNVEAEPPLCFVFDSSAELSFVTPAQYFGELPVVSPRLSHFSHHRQRSWSLSDAATDGIIEQIDKLTEELNAI